MITPKKSLNIIVPLLFIGPILLSSILSGGFAVPIWAIVLTSIGGLINLAWYAETFRSWYKNYWLKFLFWFNNTWIMGGRANAGQRVKIAQRVRLFANALVITVFFSTATISTILSGGLAFPLWAMAVMGFGITLNFFALPITSSGNTVKIQTYYDTEWELQTLNNEKGRIEQEPPHGLLHSGQDQFRMLLYRYLHDLNGLVGTLFSWGVALYDLLYPVITIFAAPVAGGLTLASRLSGAISASGAPFTYKKRLSVHTQNINDQITVYYDICCKKTPERHQRVQKLIDIIFSTYPIKKTKYYEWLKFRCYRAIERALQEGAAENLIAQTVQFELKTICSTKNGINEISRTKLREILKQTRKGALFAVLDALPIFEEKLYQKLKQPDATIDLSLLRNQFTKDINGYRELFVNYFKSAWLKEHADFNALERMKWNEKLTSLKFVLKTDAGFTFDINALKNHEDWAIDTSHGKQLLPTHHIKKLATLLAFQCEPPATTPILIAKTETIEEIADKIWLSVVPKKTDNEYDYDDHETAFQGGMFSIKEFLIAELAKDNSVKKQEELELKLKRLIPKITQESIVRKHCGYAYKYFNFKNLHSATHSYATPWLKESSVVESTLKIAVSM